MYNHKQVKALEISSHSASHNLNFLQIHQILNYKQEFLSRSNLPESGNTKDTYSTPFQSPEDSERRNKSEKYI